MLSGVPIKSRRHCDRGFAAARAVLSPRRALPDSAEGGDRYVRDGWSRRQERVFLKKQSSELFLVFLVGKLVELPMAVADWPFVP
ncbi:hypothetical protein SKAU_G00012380 [Synaphobranchus kaupii]|uniref:Uncharacterized protein n=1 Tax=Synaphobranchus kaupii TaxID=118154 RepID=A0A9Q1JD35_SYNKA|nr:hypothetical protein SKAU_G00012380 [Synaphobranchus kaupii]